MSKFKVGDKVKINHPYTDIRNGEMGVVIDVSHNYGVSFGDGTRGFFYAEEALLPVAHDDNSVVVDADKVVSVKPQDPPKPSYYYGKVWKINRTLVAAPDLLAAIEVFVRENENVVIESITLLDKENALVKV